MNAATSKGSRTASRLAAAQALYQLDIAPIPVEDVLAQALSRPVALSEEGEGEGTEIAEPDADLLVQLIRGGFEDREELDGMIRASLSADWPFERLEPLVHAILLAGAYELWRKGDVPARVVVSEYVGIAHAFYTGAEPGMINAVLDRLARKLREGEFQDGAG
jgi:N utilization substance protein B